jgi:structure-specific recognition protein 1
LTTPRGRYDIDMYDTFLRLRGKTYDYKISYDQVVRLFLLPKPDDAHVLFVVGVDPPLRQGQTRYGFLVVQFTREEDMEVELNIEEYVPSEKLECYY